MSATMNPPSGPRPPDSRVRWHILASLAGTAMAAALLWCTISVENTALAFLGAFAAALLWGLSSFKSSLGYLVPGVLFGGGALLHHYILPNERFDSYLYTPVNGVIVALALGFAIGLHYARRDGRQQVLDDRQAAAVHASHPPTSRTRRHIVVSVAAVALTVLAYLAAIELGRPWSVIVSVLLLGGAAALGGLSSLSPVVAGGGGAILAVFGDDPRFLVVGILVLLSGALSCRLAREEGLRAERRELAVAPSTP